MTLLLIYISLALIVSFICSVFEAVLLSITASYIAHLAKRNPKAAQRLKRQKKNIDSPLIAILTFNTLAHTAGAAGAGVQAAQVFGQHLVGVFSAILTLAILFMSEIIPKTIGANYWRQMAPSVSWWLQGLEWLTKPLAWCVMHITKFIGNGQKNLYVRQEMHAMADLGHESGELAKQEAEFLKEMLKAKDLHVGDFMTPRTVMFCVSQNMTNHEFVLAYQDNPFSRIPLYEKQYHNVVGYIFRDDILVAEKKTPDASLKELKRDILVLPETVKLLSAFKSMSQRKVQIALVVNEYGNTLGLLTMEDLIESLLGLEIVESKDPVTDMQHLAKNLWQQRIQDKGIVISEDKPSPPTSKTKK